ncbi:endospore germination permease [Paenibacillus sp. strain BS8-2]
MMKIKPFGILPTACMLILSIGLLNHVLIVPLILNTARRDAWMTVIVALLMFLPMAAIPLHGALTRLQGKRLDHWLKERIPPFAVWIMMGYSLLFVLFISTQTIIVTISWIATTFLSQTPPIVIMFVFISLSMYAASLGLRTIAFVSTLLLPAVVFVGDFVMSANLPHKDYRYLLPMFERGLPPIWEASLYSITAFGELYVLLLVQHHIKQRFKIWHLIVLLLFLALLSIGPVTGAISEFGPVEAEKMLYPAFSQWRLVTIGRYFEHVDFFAIYQWLSGAMVRISLSIFLLIEFTPIAKMKHKWIGMLLIGLLIGSYSYYWLNHLIKFADLTIVFFTYAGLLTCVMLLAVYGISFLKTRRGNHGRTGA